MTPIQQLLLGSGPSGAKGSNYDTLATWAGIGVSSTTYVKLEYYKDKDGR